MKFRNWKWNLLAACVMLALIAVGGFFSPLFWNPKLEIDLISASDQTSSSISENLPFPVSLFSDANLTSIYIGADYRITNRSRRPIQIPSGPVGNIVRDGTKSYQPSKSFFLLNQQSETQVKSIQAIDVNRSAETANVYITMTIRRVPHAWEQKLIQVLQKSTILQPISKTLDTYFTPNKTCKSQLYTIEIE